MKTLTPGKMRGLQATANGRQCFTILAIDHGASFAAAVRPDEPDSATPDEISGAKRDVVTALAPYASAVLVDPAYGLPPAVLGGGVPGSVGLLAPVEDQDYASDHRATRLLSDWGVAEAQRAGVDAIKLFFFYHPGDKGVAAHQEMIVRRLVEACRAHDMPLFAEPVSYDVAPGTRRQVVVESARRISRLGVDVMKVEFPVDAAAEPDEGVWAEACAELTAACATPWALLSAGVDFATFARQVQVACRAGASGYLAGRAVWKEGVATAGEPRAAFLATTARERLQALAAIVAADGRPWTDHYPYQSDAPDPKWYARL